MAEVSLGSFGSDIDHWVRGLGRVRPPHHDTVYTHRSLKAPSDLLKQAFDRRPGPRTSGPMPGLYLLYSYSNKHPPSSADYHRRLFCPTRGQCGQDVWTKGCFGKRLLLKCNELEPTPSYSRSAAIIKRNPACVCNLTEPVIGVNPGGVGGREPHTLGWGSWVSMKYYYML